VLHHESGLPATGGPFYFAGSSAEQIKTSAGIFIPLKDPRGM
jgi:hypothetical protein